MANSATVGQLRVLLTADTAEFQTAMQNSAEQAKQWGDGMGELGGKITATLAPLGGLTGALTTLGTVGAGALLALAGASVKYALELKDVQERTGATIEGLQDLRYASEATGTSFTSVMRAVESLQDRLGKGTKGLVGAIAELGLNFDELRKMPIDQALFTIQKALLEVGNETDRVRLQTLLFGEEWRDAAKVIQSDTQQIAEDTIRMSQLQVDAIDRAVTSVVGLIKSSYGQLKTFIGSALADAVIGVERVVALTRLNWAVANKDAEKAIQVVLDAMKRDGVLVGEAVQANLVEPMQSYTALLKQAKTDVANLTAEQRNQIRAALDLGTSIKDIAATTGLSEEAVKLYRTQVKDAEKDHARMATSVQRDLKQIQAEQQRWNRILEEFTDEDLVDFTAAYKAENAKWLESIRQTEQGTKLALEGMGIEVTKLGGAWENGTLDIEAYKAGMSRELGIAGEKVIGFKETMKGAFTDIKGIVSGTLSAMVDDVFDKFGILGDILSGFINNAIKWLSDWAFGLLNLGKTATTSAAQVVAANQAAAAATQAAAASAAASIASWLSLGSVIAGTYLLITKLFETFLPTTPVTLPRTPDPIRDDPAKKAPEPGDDIWGRDPGFALGAVVTRPTRAVIGEAGPEAVIPLNELPGLMRQMGSGSSAPNITIQAFDALSIREWLVRTGGHELLRYFETNDGGGSPVSPLTRFKALAT
jgi:hypothetical protein